MIIHTIKDADARIKDHEKFGVLCLPDDISLIIGDVLVLCAKDKVRCVEVDLFTAMLDWIKPGGLLVKGHIICDIDSNHPEPTPGGAMRNAWDKGKTARAAGHDLNSYPGDKGTAPHKVWLKGYLWEYCSKL